MHQSDILTTLATLISVQKWYFVLCIVRACHSKNYYEFSSLGNCILFILFALYIKGSCHCDFKNQIMYHYSPHTANNDGHNLCSFSTNYNFVTWCYMLSFNLSLSIVITNWIYISDYEVIAIQLLQSISLTCLYVLSQMPIMRIYNSIFRL